MPGHSVTDTSLVESCRDPDTKKSHAEPQQGSKLSRTSEKSGPEHPPHFWPSRILVRIPDTLAGQQPSLLRLHRKPCQARSTKFSLGAHNLNASGCPATLINKIRALHALWSDHCACTRKGPRQNRPRDDSRVPSESGWTETQNILMSTMHKELT